MNWWKNLKGKLKLDEPLKNHTTFKIGGPAKYFIEPKDADDLKTSVNLVKRYKLPLLVIGGGSNLLISDKGINGVVIRLNSPYFKKFSLIIIFVWQAQVAFLARLLRIQESAVYQALSF